jgi:hypothetical protein
LIFASFRTEKGFDRETLGAMELGKEIALMVLFQNYGFSIGFVYQKLFGSLDLIEYHFLVNLAGKIALKR